MAINRVPFNALVDDDGSNTVGSIWNKLAIKDVLLDPIDAALTTNAAAAESLPGITVVSTTGNITALPKPSGTGDLVTYMNQGSLATIQGMAASSVPGQRWTIYALSAQVDLSHNDAASTGSKLYNWATTGKTSLVANFNTPGVAVYQNHNGVGWRLVSHEQGGWITPAFAASTFAAVGAMTWTVGAGNVITCRYRLSGRTINFVFYLTGTSVGGTLNNALYITAPAWGGFTAAAQSSAALSNCVDGATGEIRCFARLNAATVLQLFKSTLANWTASASVTSVDGSITFEVV
jgi:hypothetical protein